MSGEDQSDQDPMDGRPASSSFMDVANIMGPFVSEGLAARLGFIILAEKYPRPIFSPRQPGIVVDKGDVWLVIFENALVSLDDHNTSNWPWPKAAGMPVPRRLGISIRKKNGEIVRISSPNAS